LLTTRTPPNEFNVLIYADFNGLEDCSPADGYVCLDLTGYGTLASLSLQQLRLRVGQHLTLCDPDGLQVAAEIAFDATRVSERCSGWFGRFKRSDIKVGPSLEHNYSVHTCFKCRRNLKPYLGQVGQNFNEICPHCGTPVMFPLLPPE
jgi:hypothetical protein